MAEESTLSSQIDAAFAAAGSEHSGEPERAPDAAAATETAAEAETQTPDEAQAQPPATDGADDEILSPQEVAKLKGDPAALDKAYKAAYTRKTQALAEERKQLQQLTESLQTDPEGTLRAIAEQYGVKLPALPAAPTPEQTATQQAVDEIAAFAEQNFGPEVAKPLVALAEMMTRREVQKTIEPLRAQQQEQQAVLDRQKAEAARAANQALLKEFSVKHPGWEKHDDRMSDIMSKFQPVPPAGKKLSEMSEEESLEMRRNFLESVYYLATRDISEAEKTKAVQAKMVAAAKKADSPDSGVPPQRVAKAAPKFDSVNAAIEQSFKDATEGVLYE